MLTLTFNPAPLLTIDNEQFFGINIIEKLYELAKESTEARELFEQAASVFQRTRIPKIGFCVQDSRAVVPTKHIADVGYDITVISIFKQATELTTMYETYVSINIPLGYYVELVPRSSLSKSGYMLANSIGIIDPGYTGTIKVPLVKVDPSTPDLVLPARVAQLILKQYVISDSYTTNELVETSRGNGGFGSTG